MVRLLYGARASLIIGISAALITALLATLLGLLAGYLRGWVDATIRPVLDVIWAFPVILLGVALGTALALGGPQARARSRSRANSKLIPILVIAVVYVPYMARPLRGQVLGLREKEFVEAARAQGAGPAAGHVLRAAAQPVVHDRGVPAADGGQRRAAGGRAVVPGGGRQPARAVVGQHDRLGRGAHRDRAPPGDRARA